MWAVGLPGALRSSQCQGLVGLVLGLFVKRSTELRDGCPEHPSGASEITIAGAQRCRHQQIPERTPTRQDQRPTKNLAYLTYRRVVVLDPLERFRCAAIGSAESGGVDLDAHELTEQLASIRRDRGSDGLLGLRFARPFGLADRTAGKR